MTGRYAANTEVSSDQSRVEIERTLKRYGADSFLYAFDQRRAVVEFILNARRVRFAVPLPDRDAREFTHTPERGLLRSQTQRDQVWEQATRQKWRALALMIKAKLEAVESGIVSFDQEFAPMIVLPDGRTVADYVVPAITEAYETNTVPALLPEYVPALPAGQGTA